ncbi:hypothetical protein DFH11DRAFT_1816064 [Phellopilus nigrolimitatus]|nr:hypothetical protein DFH11DRAFT_1816064 [Phellopilus nigrolimitatus]
MHFLSSVLLVAALALGVVEAKPSKISGGLFARGEVGGPTKTSKDCSEKEFFYDTRSCCLPSGAWYFHHGEGCCVPKAKPTHSATPTCGSNWSWSLGLQCCTPQHSSTPKPNPQPKPSAKPNSKGHVKAKRNALEQWDMSFCPTGLTTCPIKVNGAMVGDSECVDTLSELTSCGGCASLNKGVDCQKISNATNSSCAGGVCVVAECAAGFKPSDDESSCIAA